MTEAQINTLWPLPGDHALKHYWDNLKTQRAVVDPALLGTSEIAVIYTACSGDTARAVAVGTDQDSATPDSLNHA